MPSKVLNNFKIYTAEQIKYFLSNGNDSKIYFAIGKVEPWSNVDAPDSVYSSTDQEYEVWSNMIGAKKLTSSDLQHAIPINLWETDTVYFQYDFENEDTFDSNNQFYITTSEYKVYKCLSNNQGALSTIEPSSINTTTPIQTADGYIWKYMYSIAGSDILKFTTTDYVPVKKITIDDGSLQWQVQDNAVDGALEVIDVTDGGSGYVNSNTVTITISGDGTGATAIANVNVSSQTVSSIVVTNAGTGYTFANVTVTDSGSGNGAIARAMIGPFGGHGSNPVYELNGRNLMVYARLNFDEDGILPTENQYHQISIIKDPIKYGTSNVSSNSVVAQYYVLNVTGEGDYTEDEFVYQGTSPTNYTFKARVMRWDSANSKIYTINNIGNPGTATLYGVTSGSGLFVNNITEPELNDHSGLILYVNNIKEITRASNQQETFQILMKF